MQVPETKNIGDALGFGSAFLFSSVFGMCSLHLFLVEHTCPLSCMLLNIDSIFLFP